MTSPTDEPISELVDPPPPVRPQAELEQVQARDAETIVELERAAEALANALRAMPNDVASAFEPAIDVKLLTGALEAIRLITADAQARR